MPLREGQGAAKVGLMMRILGGCLLVLVCTGCIRRVDEKTTITWWQFWTDSRAKPVIEELVATFEGANPNINVDVVDLTWAEGHQKIVVAFATGTTPDVLELGSDWVAEFSSKGLLLDLTAEAERHFDQFAMWEPVAYEGRIYGYPWLLGTRVLFYNKDLMRRAQIDTTQPPATWSEWLRQARAINDLKGDVHGFAANTFERHRLYKKFLPFFWSAGGELMVEGGCGLDSKAGLAALKFYRELCKVGVFDVQRELDLAFQRGQIGFTISGDWLLQQLRKDPKAPRYGLALMPRSDSGISVSFAGGEYLVVPKKSAHAQEAQLFIDFLLQPENNLKLCRAIGFVPAHTAAAANPYFSEDAHLNTFNRQLESSRATPVHPRWVEMEEVIESAVERAMYGGTSPDSALERACSEIEAILSRK